MTVCTRGAAFGLEVGGPALRALRLAIDFPSSVAVLKRSAPQALQERSYSETLIPWRFNGQTDSFR